jgi:hypothetical protein
MDRIGNGANVLAFVILGIQCASIIYTALDGVKSIRDDVDIPATRVQQLKSRLERLLLSRAAITDANLSAHIKALRSFG